MSFIEKWGGLSFIITVWLVGWRVLGFEPTVIVMLATLLWTENKDN